MIRMARRARQGPATNPALDFGSEHQSHGLPSDPVCSKAPPGSRRTGEEGRGSEREQNQRFRHGTLEQWTLPAKLYGRRGPPPPSTATASHPFGNLASRHLCPLRRENSLCLCVPLTKKGWQAAAAFGGVWRHAAALQVIRIFPLSKKHPAIKYFPGQPSSERKGQLKGQAQGQGQGQVRGQGKGQGQGGSL